MAESAKQQTALDFQSSKHKVLGVEGPLVEMFRDNAPRVVGGLRLASILMASVVHPLLGLHAAFVLGSEAVLLLFGNRQNVKKHKEEEGEKPLFGQVGKALQPHKYPLESSAALDVLGEIPHLLLGASIVFGFDIPGMESMLGEQVATDAGHAGHEAHGDVGCAPGHEGHAHCNGDGPERRMPSFAPHLTDSFAHSPSVAESAAPVADAHAGHAHPTGIALMVHGALGVLGHLPLLLFGPEKEGQDVDRLDLAGDNIRGMKKDAPLEFARSKSKVVGAEDKGVIQWFKDNQVVISSVLQMAIGVTMMVATGMPAMYQLAGVPLFAAGAIQALFVRKREFSAETAIDQKAENKVHSLTHDGKLSTHEHEQEATSRQFA